MRAGYATAALATALALTACGDRNPDPKAGGLKDMDISKTQMVDARKADVDTLRTRRINGLWQGRAGDADVQADIASDGTMSMMVMRSGSVAEQARGTWRWSDGNTLAGSLEGGGSALSGYSSWTGGFPTTNAILVTGTGGSMTLQRRRGSPRPAAGGPGVVTPEMMERAYRGEK